MTFSILANKSLSAADGVAFADLVGSPADASAARVGG
jgi:hypothetical protein